MSMIAPKLVSENHPLGEKIELSANGPAMALVALSHTRQERYEHTAMLNAAELRRNPLRIHLETRSGSSIESRTEVFTVHRVMEFGRHYELKYGHAAPRRSGGEGINLCAS